MNPSSPVPPLGARAADGTVDRTLAESTDKAYDDGASPFYYFAPLIENLHADPRHAADLRRMGLFTPQRP